MDGFTYMLFFTIFFSTVSITSSAREMDKNSASAKTTEPAITFFMNYIVGNQNQSPTVATIGDHRRSPFPQLGDTFSPTIGIPRNSLRTRQHQSSIGWLTFLTAFEELEPGFIREIDEELSGSLVLGLPLRGKVQGVYVTSCQDNSNHMVAIKAAFIDGRSQHSLSFVGLHRPDLPESHIAVVGGTGKYTGANGYAVVKTSSLGHGNPSLDEIFWFPV